MRRTPAARPAKGPPPAETRGDAVTGAQASAPAPTRRKRVKEATLESDEIFRTLFDRSLDCMVHLDLEGRFLDANDAALDLFGFRRDELATLNFLSLLSEDQIPLVLQAIEELKRTGFQKVPHEYRLRRKDATQVVVEIRTSLVQRRGVPVAMLVIGRDITSRKAAELSLEASEKRYRRLFEAARDGILILDADSGMIVDVNPFLVETTGYSYQNLLGKHVWEIGPFHDILASKEQFAELQDRKYVRYDDLPLKTRDGRTIAVEFVSNVYRVDGQNVIQCNIRDISERKAAEEALRRSVAFNRTMVESIPQRLFLKDRNSVYLAANPAYAASLGIRPEQVVGKDDFAFFPEELASKYRADDREVMESGRMKDIEESYLAKGKSSLIRTIKAPVRNTSGEVFAVLGIFEDITDRKQEEEARRNFEAASRQNQRLEAIGTLASGVAHEINNPLNVIMNYGQLLLDHPSDPVQVRDFASSIILESERMAVIVRNLLSFSRQEKESHSPARLADIVEKTLTLTRAVLRKDQITILSDIPEDLPIISCRSQQIQQVLMNLLTNARDALNERYPKSGEDKIIRILASSWEKDGMGWVRLTVEDHGSGIPPDVAARVFDPFYTTKGRDKGTGLGLSISRGIVVEHDGILSFESDPVRGTRFHVDLPVDNGLAAPNRWDV